MVAEPDQPPRAPAADAADERGAPVGRRVILGLLTLGTAGVLGGRAVQSQLDRVLAPVELHDPTGLISLLPWGDTFRYYSVTGGAPRRTANDYRLNVSGLVESPATYTLADLQARPQTRIVRDFQCVTGWRVPAVHWSGIQVSDLIDASRPLPGASAVRLTSFDGTYTESLTLDQARRTDVLVALQMLDKPITHDHGGPVRLFVAPMYGYKSLKWLSGIELTATVETGYWEQRGYSVDGWVGRSNGRDDEPTG